MKALVLGAWLFRFVALATSVVLLCLAHPRLRQRWAVQRSFVAARWVLALLMILYGVVKLTGTQLHHRETLDGAHVMAFGSAQLFWYFFGYSRLYVVFAGAVEIACGLLLASHVTRRLGVLLTMMTLTNIVVMDFAFNIEPKYWALSLLLATVALLLQELPAYWTATVRLTRGE
jgi:uncharacterized membrane protein YphA (DoxX/SURF4 family)